MSGRLDLLVGGSAGVIEVEAKTVPRGVAQANFGFEHCAGFQDVAPRHGNPMVTPPVPVQEAGVIGAGEVGLGAGSGIPLGRGGEAGGASREIVGGGRRSSQGKSDVCPQRPP